MTRLPSTVRLALTIVACTILSTAVRAQEQGSSTPPPDSRAAEIERRAQEKSRELTPYEGSKAERYFDALQEGLLGGRLGVHPWFESAYAGGGFTLGAGWARHISSYNFVDLRGSFTVKGYKRLEGEFRAPRMFDRRGVLSVLGGWREATDVGFYGIGTDNTSQDDRVNYGFREPYIGATLDVRPARNWFVVGGGAQYERWEQRGGDSFPSVEQVFTPQTLQGLGARTSYIHPHVRLAFDSRPSPGYARSGGYYGATAHAYVDVDDVHSFQQVDYEAVQHLPFLRDTWVLSLRGRMQTTYTSSGETIPFFMLPALGGGSTLRGFSSWRFRDRHSLLLTAEWRVLANAFLDMAVFYDAGQVVPRVSDFDLGGLKSDYGLGFRFHGPANTPLRIEFAKSNERFQIVFAAKSAF